MWLVGSWRGMDIAGCVSEGGEDRGAAGWGGLSVALHSWPNSPFSLLYPTHFLGPLGDLDRSLRPSALQGLDGRPRILWKEEEGGKQSVFCLNY